MLQNDRRSAHRYLPAKEKIRLGWWQGQLFQTISARLRNLSVSGALVEPEKSIADRAGVKAWLCLVDHTAAHWIEAEIVEVCSPEPDSPLLLRLRFLDPFPYEFFKAAVWDQGSAAADDALHVATPMPPARNDGDAAIGKCRPAVYEPRRPQSLSQFTAPPVAPRVPRHEAVAPTFAAPPTLPEAYRSQFVSSRKVAFMPWLMMLAIGLLVSILLVLLARGHMVSLGGLRIVLGWT